jgi:hypothetical protein
MDYFYSPMSILVVKIRSGVLENSGKHNIKLTPRTEYPLDGISKSLCILSPK